MRLGAVGRQCRTLPVRTAFPTPKKHTRRHLGYQHHVTSWLRPRTAGAGEFFRHGGHKSSPSNSLKYCPTARLNEGEPPMNKGPRPEAIELRVAWSSYERRM